MNLRKHMLEALTLIVAAVICAMVSNAVASRERKMALVGNYPSAQKVPSASAEPTATLPSQPAAVTTAPPTRTTDAVTAPAPATETVAATQQPATATSTAAPAAKTVPPATAAVKEAPLKVPDVTRFQPHPDKPYLEIAYDDVAALHTSGALVLDARRTSIYEQGHIAGARPFSVWESDVDDKVNKLYEERGDPRDQAKPIVIYCSGGECEDSHMLAQKLWGIQFNNVYVYKDGFPDWQKRGGAVHTGATP